MKILYFGNKENKKIILVHGFQAPYTMWKEYIDYFKNDYCIVIPVLPGHELDEKEKFTSFDDALDEFEQEYLEQFGKEVFLIYAVSIGGVFATKLFSRGNLTIRKIVLESSPLLPLGKCLQAFARKKYLKINKIIHQENNIILRTIKRKLNNENLYNDFCNVMTNMSDSTIIAYLNESLNYTFPRTVNTKRAEIYYYYGGHPLEFMFKSGSKYLKKYYPETKAICIRWKKHCADVIVNAIVKIKMLDNILNK